MRLIIVSVLVFVCFSYTATPASACYGGAPLSMGGAYVAQAEGALSIYWNPAGLAFGGGRGDLSLTQTSPLESINYNRFVGMSFTGEEAGWGLGSTQLADWHPIEKWLQFSLGLRVDQDNALGITYRRESWRNGESYISWDWGWQYRRDRLSLGILVQDASEEFANIRPGIAYRFNKATLALSLYDLGNRNGEYGMMAGIEMRPWKFLSLRVGEYLGNQTFGVGVSWKNVRVDWAYLGEELGKVHHVTVNYQF